tara:strand:- start:222 stop:1274 length:1053 start_codon:yes stop_codon:yes gene_type:complete
MKKIRFLESIRGISALVVLLFHLKDTTNSILIHNFLILNGKIFVDFFFVLSGFVIAHNYSSKIHTLIDLLKFKFKRFLRLYPLHILTLIIFVFIEWTKYFLSINVGIFPSSEPFSINNINSFIHNLFLTHAFLSVNSFNIPSWSIGVEFYTYLLFSLIILFIKNKNMCLFLFIGISLSSFLYIILGSGTITSMENEDGFIRCCFSFFLGSTIFSLQSFFSIKPKLANYLILFFLCLMFIALFIKNNFIGILTFAMIISISVKEEENYFVKILNFKPLVYLGSISYGIYMFHFLVIWVERQISKYILKVNPDSFIIIITTITFSILLAHISKIYLEDKFTSLGKNIKFTKN